MARKNSAPADAPAAGEQVGKQKKPKKQRWYHQVWAAYQMTRKQDPTVTWLLLGVFVGILAVVAAIVLLLDVPTGFKILYIVVLGIPFAMLGAMFVLTRKAERAAYTQIEGQPGAAGAALRVLRRGWTYDEQPVAADPRTQDTVFRAVGRPGVVLVGDGPEHRIGKLLEAERRKVARVLPGVPIHVIQAGNGEEQVPLRRLGRRVTRLKPALTKAEVAEVNKRLRALGGLRPPIPKGIDPFRARPDRRAQRGR